MTDARKGAITDGLTKAASMLGVGHEVFKGLVRTGDAKSSSQSNGHANNGFEPRPQPLNPRRAIPAKEQVAAQPNNAKSNVVANGSNGAKQSNGDQPTNGTDRGGSTAFWLFANSEAAKTVDRSTATALAKQVIEGKGTWQDALAKLKDMADGSATTQTLRMMESSDPLDMLFK